MSRAQDDGGFEVSIGRSYYYHVLRDIYASNLS